VTTTVLPPAPAGTRAPGVRLEVQALRAVAVLGVVVYHLWPLRLPGGYVGVDVFFVVSGFLISDHLMREYTARGRIALGRFWAKRARRLLPASLLVLVVTLGATLAFAPLGRHAQFGWEIIASAFYVENWALAAQSVDYMALSNVKSPVQHFWSLGVEEQFYLVWPLLLLVAGALAARLGRGRAHGVLWGIVLVGGASLVYSIVLTALTPSVAYFSTATRAWEFAAGALLALLLRRRPAPLPPLAAKIGSWAGFAVLAATMLVFDAATPFPSWYALIPVLATVLVIAAGTPAGAGSPSFLFGRRPVQFIGDVSYGTYLWHWPIIVLLPYALHRRLSTLECVVILFAVVALGWASKRFVEDPIRRLPSLAAGPTRRTFLAVAIATGGVAALSLPAALTRILPPEPSAATLAGPCTGAHALAAADCGPVESTALLAPLESFALDVPPADILACERSTTSGEYVRCDFGDLEGDGPHVALIGDSHGTRIVEPLRDAILERGGSLSTFLVSGCAMTSREVTGNAWTYDAPYAEQCRDLSVAAHDEVAADPTINLVVLTNRTRLYVSDDVTKRPLTAEMVGDTIDALRAAGKDVVVLTDPPEMHPTATQGGASATDCLQWSAPDGCGVTRAEAAFPDPMSEGAAAAGARVVDLTDRFCTDERCMAQVGGIVVYSDDNHLTRTYARTLQADLAERLWATAGAR